MNRIVETKINGCVTDTDTISYGDHKYQLKTVIVHLGNFAGSGHYVTYNLEDEKMFDDSPRPSYKLVSDYAMNVAKLSGYIYGYERLER